MAEAATESVELASVYVSLVPSLRGAPEAIAKGLRGAATRQAGRQVGDQVVAGISTALSKAAGIPKAVAGLSGKIAAGFRDARQSVELVGKAMAATRRIAGEAAGYVSKSWQGTSAALGRMIPGLSKVQAGFAAVRRGGTQALSAVTGAARNMGTRIYADAYSALVKTQRAFTPVSAAASKAFNAVAGVAKNTGTRIYAEAYSAIAKVRQAVSPITNHVAANMQATRAVVGNAMSQIGASWSSAWAKMPAPVQALPGKITAAFGNVGSSVGRVLSTGLSGAVNVAANVAGKVGSAISGAIGVGVRAAGVAVAGLAGIISANLGGAIQRADMLNNFPKVMENIGYSADEAREQIDRISDSLDGLPTSTQAVTQTAKGLAPLTGSLTSATDVALALNDALLAGGASAGLAESAMEQYRQMLAVGKVDMAAWRSLQSAMPGQLDQIAKSLLGATANSSELYDAMADGNVTFEQFNDALVKLDSEGIDGLASFHDQAITATAGIGTAFQNAKNRIVKAIASVIEAIGVDEISAKINAATSGIVGFGNKIADTITSIKKDGGFEGIGAAIGGLTPVIGGVVGALGPLLTGIPGLGKLFTGLTGPVGVVIGLFGSMVANSQTLRDSITGAFSSLQEAMDGSGTQEALQTLSNALGLVARTMGDSLGKAINLVAPLLSQMAATVLPLLANVLRTVAVAVTPIATTIMGAISQALAAILPVVTNIAATVLPALAAIIQTVSAALAPVIDVITGIFVDAIQIIAPIFEQLVNGLLPPLQSAVQTIAPVLSQMLVSIGNMAQQILPALGEVLSTVVSVVVRVAQTVLPTLVNVINGVIKVVTSVINVVSAALVPAINVASKLISAAVRVVGNIFTWLWNNAVSPVANWITTKMTALSNFFDTTVKPKITNVATKIGEAFGKMKDTIGNAFDQVKAKAAKPINFVIGTVYTDGIKKLVDNIMSKLGLSLRMPVVAKIPGYASGGVLPGYTPGRDVYHFVSPDGGGVLALSGGEAIMRPEWVRAVGGAGAVDAMNRAAARGGSVPGGDIGRGYRPGQTAFALGGIWNSVKNGVSGGIDWLKDTATAVADIISDPLGAVENLVRKPVDALLNSHSDNGVFWDAAKAIPGKVISGIGDWLKNKTATMSASGLVDMARKAIGTPYVWGGTSVPGGVDCSGLVVWALRQLGHNVPRHTASTFQAASTPGDRNTPGNLLFWGGSIGAGGAHHVAIASGKGMLIEAPHQGATVVERAIWGSPSAGVFKYDDGGWLQPGLTTTLNATGKPEPVFTSGQWDKMDRLLDLLENDRARDLVVRDVDDELVGRMRAEAIGVIADTM